MEERNPSVSLREDRAMDSALMAGPESNRVGDGSGPNLTWSPSYAALGGQDPSTGHSTFPGLVVYSTTNETDTSPAFPNPVTSGSYSKEY